MTDKHARSPSIMLLCSLLGGCADTTPETRIRAAIAGLESAVEERSPRAALELLSANFSAEDGQLDRAGMRGFLASQMLGAERIEVVLGPIDIVLHGERATAQFSALVSGGRYLGERNETLQLRTGWRLEEGTWRCYLAERVARD